MRVLYMFIESTSQTLLDPLNFQWLHTDNARPARVLWNQDEFRLGKILFTEELQSLKFVANVGIVVIEILRIGVYSIQLREVP